MKSGGVGNSDFFFEGGSLDGEAVILPHSFVIEKDDGAGFAFSHSPENLSEG